MPVPPAPAYGRNVEEQYRILGRERQADFEREARRFARAGLVRPTRKTLLRLPVLTALANLRPRAGRAPLSRASSGRYRP
jgi:hypothetical protein